MRGARQAAEPLLLGTGLFGVVALAAWDRPVQLLIGGVLVLVIAGTSRRHPFWTLLAGASTALVNLIDLHTFPVWPVVVSLVGCFLAGRRTADGLLAVPAFAGVALAGLVLAAVGPGGLISWINVLLPMAVFGVLPFLAGLYARQRAALREAGWRRAAQLERERRLIVEEARLRERARIAADMHDSLGHDLSLIAMRAGALEIDVGLDDRTRAAAGELRAAAADATDRMREIIGVLGAGPAPTEPAGESIAELVARTRDSGMSVTLDGADAADGLPEMAARAAYRVVREALTNAAKHAPGAPVAVTLTPADDAVTVTVVSGAPRTPPVTASGGRGLIGLRERVRLAGGTLRAGPRDDGFEVVARLPRDVDPAIAEADADPAIAEADADPAVADADTDPAVAEADAQLDPPPQERIQAGHRVRRTLLAVIGVQVGVLVLVSLLVLVLRVAEVTQSRLPAGTYAALRVGASRAEIARSLPSQQVDGRPDVPEPPIPAGARCEYYRVSGDLFSGPIDVYRLCFADGVLVAKDFVPGRSS
ncbi:MAG: sensor histidine kinase [Hamadaea sp.]|nr:sensor histidine kinase [Hamadaea sp.]